MTPTHLELSVQRSAFLEKEGSNPHHADVGVSALRKDE